MGEWFSHLKFPIKSDSPGQGGWRTERKTDFNTIEKNVHFSTFPVCEQKKERRRLAPEAAPSRMTISADSFNLPTHSGVCPYGCVYSGVCMHTHGQQHFFHSLCSICFFSKPPSPFPPVSSHQKYLSSESNALHFSCEHHQKNTQEEENLDLKVMSQASKQSV